MDALSSVGKVFFYLSEFYSKSFCVNTIKHIFYQKRKWKSWGELLIIKDERWCRLRQWDSQYSELPSLLKSKCQNVYRFSFPDWIGSPAIVRSRLKFWRQPWHSILKQILKAQLSDALQLLASEGLGTAMSSIPIMRNESNIFQMRSMLLECWWIRHPRRGR